MKQVIRALNRMVNAGVIENYAIADAVAVIIHAEPFSTKDLDVLVHLPETPAGLAILTPIYKHLTEQGHRMEGQHFVIGGVPVDFMDAHGALTKEALDKAVEVTAWGEKTRVARPEHLIALALVVGRKKDHAKIEMLLNVGRVKTAYLTDLLKRHRLKGAWDAYQRGAS